MKEPVFSILRNPEWKLYSTNCFFLSMSFFFSNLFIFKICLYPYLHISIYHISFLYTYIFHNIQCSIFYICLYISPYTYLYIYVYIYLSNYLSMCGVTSRYRYGLVGMKEAESGLVWSEADHHPLHGFAGINSNFYQKLYLKKHF